MRVPSETRHRGARFLLVSASLVLVIAGLREIKPIALPFLIAIFLSVLNAPLLSWLIRHRWPKPVAVLTTVAANLAALAVVMLLVAGSIRAFTESLPTYQERLEAQTESTLSWLDELGIDTSELEWLLGRRAGQEEPAPPLRFDPAERRTQEGTIGLGSLVGVVGSTLLSLVSLASMSLIVLLMMIFILLEAGGLPRKLELALDWSPADLERMRRAKREVQRYLGYKTLISLVTGVAIGLWVEILGVDFAVLWGLIAFVLNYIPTLGSIIASVPTVILALIDLGPAEALLVGLGYLAVNIFLGNFVEPQLMGRKLGISTLVVFLSLIFWGWVWGPLGMLLSVPLTMILRIALENTEDFRWLAQLIAADAGNTLPRRSSGEAASL
ncbi:MAG: AI-2E family transporter [Acidobacteriota bacterium]